MVQICGKPYAFVPPSGHLQNWPILMELFKKVKDEQANGLRQKLLPWGLENISFSYLT